MTAMRWQSSLPVDFRRVAFLRHSLLIELFLGHLAARVYCISGVAYRSRSSSPSWACTVYLTHSQVRNKHSLGRIYCLLLLEVSCTV